MYITTIADSYVQINYSLSLSLIILNCTIFQNILDGHGRPQGGGQEQWCSGGGATGAIAPVPIFQGGAPLQFLNHLFPANFDYILEKLAYYSNYY